MVAPKKPKSIIPDEISIHLHHINRTKAATVNHSKNAEANSEEKSVASGSVSEIPNPDDVITKERFPQQYTTKMIVKRSQFCEDCCRDFPCCCYCDSLCIFYCNFFVFSIFQNFL